LLRSKQRTKNQKGKTARRFASFMAFLLVFSMMSPLASAAPANIKKNQSSEQINQMKRSTAQKHAVTNVQSNANAQSTVNSNGGSIEPISNYQLHNYDVSFDGDGVNDESLLSFDLSADVSYNYIELWDMMDPTAGYYGDGYLGFFHFGDYLPAGAGYELPLEGTYFDWSDGAETPIPDGMYTVDFTTYLSDESDEIAFAWDGPLVVKTTDPVITSKTELVTDQVSFNFTGQVTDKYVDYKQKLSASDTFDFDLNTKLYASYKLKNPEDVVQQGGPVTLEQDGSFYINNLETFRGTNTLTITVDDAAGNSSSAQFLIENEIDPPVVKELHVNNADVNLTVGETETLLIEEVTYDHEGNETRVDVTADASYAVENAEVVSVDQGVFTATEAGTSKVTVSYNDLSLEVNVSVAEAPVVDVKTLKVNKTDLQVINTTSEKLVVTETTTKEDGTSTDTDVTATAIYSSYDTKVVQVNQGVVTGKNIGSTEISVTVGDNTVKVSVSVAPVPVSPPMTPPTTPVLEPVTFDDIASHWAKSEIEALATKEIILGKSENKFAPEDKVTRAEFAVLVARTLELELKAYEGKFSDVPLSKEWAYAEVEAAARAGIINGSDDGTFNPDAEITREEIATIVVRAVNYADASLLKNLDTSKVFSDDANISAFARLSVKQAFALGIITGRNGNAFAPQDQATRAEAAVMLYRTLEKLSKL